MFLISTSGLLFISYWQGGFSLAEKVKGIVILPLCYSEFPALLYIAPITAISGYCQNVDCITYLKSHGGLVGR